jgi:transposase
MGEMQISDSAYASADANRAMRHSTALQEAVAKLGSIIAQLEKRIAILESQEDARHAKELLEVR